MMITDSASPPPSPPLIRVQQWVWPRTQSPTELSWRLVERIKKIAEAYRGFSQETLVSCSRNLKLAVIGGLHPSCDEILAPACALVYEAIRRRLGITLHDEQLLAGTSLAERRIAEMPTGEGKTFVAAIPAFLYSLLGRGVHVVTVNEYLAKRDFELLSPVFKCLDVSSGLNQFGDPGAKKRIAYACDVTYGVDQEFGFDYLRDQLAIWNHPVAELGGTFRANLRGEKLASAPTVQRRLAAAIVDEIDNVLLDSAVSPLLLSDRPSDPENETQIYHAALKTAEELIRDEDYFVDRESHRIVISESGHERIALAVDSVSPVGLRRPWSLYVEQSLHAREFLQKDVDYVIQDGKALLVDEFTGRFYPDRQWRDGLHQAVEVKEGVDVNAENRAIARISRQRYFQLYSHLCGMTGTAKGAERELWNVYQLQVLEIPPHKPCRRVGLPERRFASTEAKFEAIVKEIIDVHDSGRPILVGSRTIKNSEVLAEKLSARGVPFRLLNGKQDADEATIIAQSGELGAITIATNMAGRGTDIRLSPGVAELGGLHVIGVERHESARIDRQLVGRAARQGDPGSYRFYVAADDPLLTKHAPSLSALIRNVADAKGEIFDDLSNEIDRAQRRAERRHYWERHHLFQHDRWLRDMLEKCDPDAAGR